MEPTSVRGALSSDLASVAENRYAYVSLIVSCILLCCCGAFFSYFFCYYRKKRAEAKELTPYEKWMMAKEAKELDGTILNFQNESTHNPFHVESSEALLGYQSSDSAESLEQALAAWKRVLASLGVPPEEATVREVLQGW